PSVIHAIGVIEAEYPDPHIARAGDPPPAHGCPGAPACRRLDHADLTDIDPACRRTSREADDPALTGHIRERVDCAIRRYGGAGFRRTIITVEPELPVLLE